MSMDRTRDPRDRWRRRNRRFLRLGGLALVTLALLALLRQRLVPSVRAAELRLGTVDRGLVEASITATGQVLPAFEKVVSSPIEARVLEVVRQPGATLEPGDPIVRLDPSATRLQLDRLDERITQKRWQIEGRQASHASRRSELSESLEAARLDLEIASYRLDQQRRLFAEGLASEESQRQREVEQRKAELAVRGAERALADELTSFESDHRRYELELDILSKEREEAARHLDRATARSDRAGVLTWVIEEEGATVERGGVLARIADLDSFRVEAQVSDIHAARLRPGLPARLRLDGQQLTGQLDRVHPTIENGIVTFGITLDTPTHPALRNNLRVEVDLIVDGKPGALRFPRSSFLPPGRTADLFVVDGHQLHKRSVQLGLRGVDAIEVLGGLDEGDRIVLSDVRDYLYLEHLKLDGVLPPSQPLYHHQQRTERTP